MRQTGTLRSWDEARGFGFIAPTGGGAEVFVHVTALPRDGSQPTVGERVEYELGRGRDGRPAALRVVRLAIGRRPPVAAAQAATGSGWMRKAFGGLLTLVLLIGLAAYAFQVFQQHQHRRQLAAMPADARVAPSRERAADETPSFRCDGRTGCHQMRSCDEARWFIRHCPGTKMDGDGDGEPCEQGPC